MLASDKCSQLANALYNQWQLEFHMKMFKQQHTQLNVLQIQCAANIDNLLSD